MLARVVERENFFMPICQYRGHPEKRRLALRLLRKDGDRCGICHKKGDELEIDHLDLDTRNNDLSNLRLAHHSCNARRLRFRADEREKKRLHVQIVRPREDVDYQRGSPEMQVNDLSEEWFRNLVSAWILQTKKLGREGIEYQEARGACFDVDISSESADRHLFKYSRSRNSPFRVYKHPETRRRMITFKEWRWMEIDSEDDSDSGS